MAFMRERVDQYVYMRREQRAAAEQLPLPEKERRLLEPISKGNLRVREIISMSSLFRTKTCQFLVALYVNGYIELSDAPSEEANEADLLEQIKEHLSRVDRSNHFAVLDVHMSATGKDIEKAYHSLMEKYGEAALAKHSPEIREAGRALRSGLQRAFEALRDQDARQAYRREQFGEWKVKWYAEFQFNKGDSMLTLRDDPEQALLYYESACDLAPDNGTYLAALAYGRFRTIGSSAARKDAKKLLEQARKLSPSDPQVLIIAARLELDFKNNVEARDLMRQAERMCADPAKYAQLVRTWKLGEQEG